LCNSVAIAKSFAFTESKSVAIAESESITNRVAFTEPKSFTFTESVAKSLA
jgi:hypothetical protein